MLRHEVERGHVDREAVGLRQAVEDVGSGVLGERFSLRGPPPRLAVAFERARLEHVDRPRLRRESHRAQQRARIVRAQRRKDLVHLELADAQPLEGGARGAREPRGRSEHRGAQPEETAAVE